MLSSLSAAMSSLLEDHPPSTPHPSTPLSIATWSSEPSQLLLHCSSPAVAEAFLHYAYGVPVRLCLPRAVNGAVADVSVELTPDTSIASIDENDLTAEYDRYSIPNFTQEFEDLDNKVRKNYRLIAKATTCTLLHVNWICCRLFCRRTLHNYSLCTFVHIQCHVCT